MGLAHSPRIVTNGLCVCIDPANIKSYPGTGTTVNDLSGKGNHFSLQNASAYISADNVFRFTYSGTNWLQRSSLLSGFTSGAISNMSIVTFVKVTDASTTRFVSFDDLSSDTTNRLNYYIAASSFSGEKNNVLSISSGLAGGTNTNNWVMYGAVLSGSGLTSVMYRGTSSGVETGTPQTLASAPEIGNYTLIGRRGIDTFFGGDISIFLMYNTALTENEMRQNYAALRGRYGI